SENATKLSIYQIVYIGLGNLPDFRIIFIICVCTGPCQEDWVFYEDSCYFQSLTKKSWQIAEKKCVEKGSHLVVVNDLDFLSSIVKLSESYWIGLVEKKEGQWSWVDGTDYSTTEHWAFVSFSNKNI
uniref:Asialoglycoprotein receptor-like 1 n=1 Tax=Sinocyclocheilus rhinocerous TaxID=307959 RepID=A0A673GCX7_9TELE